MTPPPPDEPHRRPGRSAPVRPGGRDAFEADEETAPPAGGGARRVALDLASAYAAAGAKVASWALVTAVVIRTDVAAFALLALVRSTVGLLNYTSLGLAPGLIRLTTAALYGSPSPGSGPAPRLLAPGRPAPEGEWGAGPLLRPYSNGLALALMVGLVGVALTALYAWGFPRLHHLPRGTEPPRVLAAGMALGTVFRLMSDAPSAILQTRGRLAADNALLAAVEGVWVAGSLFGRHVTGDGPSLLAFVGLAYAVSGAALLLLRLAAASRLVGRLLPEWRLVSAPTLRRLLGFGSLVTVAQLADFLYAPTDFILINRWLDPGLVAVYAPAVQIDSGLLLVVAGLSAVLLPARPSPTRTTTRG